MLTSIFRRACGSQTTHEVVCEIEGANAMLRSWSVPAALAALLLGTPNVTPAQAQRIILAAAPQSDLPEEHPKTKGLPPEEKIEKRFPQPIRVGDLVGLPLLDHRDTTL